ncbi:MAG TPA: transglutaminaseTgpA domain-containing protein [Gaiellaceae bacterium]|nr:transglutaminaseTgpA domain-containing protein [Gaiellaceae bacterium]
MARRWLLTALVALVVTVSWGRLEAQAITGEDWLPMLLLALLPIGAVALRRSLPVVGLVLAGATLLAASVASGISLGDARPRDASRDFFGPVLGELRRGFLDFYETQLPFDRVDFAAMHTVVLLAIFGFTAVVGMLVMARKPVGAALALVVAVAWPATLVPGGRPLLAGALALVGVLAILFLLRREEPARGLVQAVGVGVLLVAIAAAASTSAAVAKPAFLSWQTWDPYDRPTAPVSVAYVWSGSYDGIQFPEEPTTVLRVKVPGGKRSLYWRATTLDDYTGLIWDEDLQLGDATTREQIDAGGPLLTEAARNEDDWVRQEFTIEALRDTRLPASAQPVRWRPETEAPVADENGDVVVVPDGIRRDQRYTVWSYAPRPNPSELNTFRGDYPEAAERYLEVVYQPVPEWATQDRDTVMDVFFGASEEFEISALESVYEAALGVTSGAQSPYEAAALLETWFREAGGFVYDEQPPAPIGGTPALVDFVNETKRGYCQHYAGAMALMLRLLGIPSRVAVGFTSGNYRQDTKEWVVRDTNAHAWVEVWFPQFGWIPFDPTPGRGELDATYAVTSQTFNAGDAAGIGFADRLEGLSPTRAEAIRSAAQTPTNPGFGAAGSSGTLTVVRDQGRGLLTVLALVLGGALAGLLLVKALRRSARFATRDPRELAGACRRDLAAYLADQGVDVPASATMPDLGVLLQRFYSVDASSFCRDVTLARFGPPDEAREALRRARRDLREIRGGLRERLGPVSRIRGALSIRSLSV